MARGESEEGQAERGPGGVPRQTTRNGRVCRHRRPEYSDSCLARSSHSAIYGNGWTLVVLRHRKRCFRCGRWRSSTAGYCRRCHAAEMREWRKTHPMTAEQRKRDACRSYAGVYLRRGKLKRQSCAVCGSSESQMHHPSYDKPLEVEWLCRRCHCSRAHSQQVRNPALAL